MHNLRSSTLRRRASALVLFAMAAILWMSASAAACTTGYYRFTNSTNVVGEWSASRQDYQGSPPYGISFFMDLDVLVYNIMNPARVAGTSTTISYVYMIPCADLIAPLTYMRAPTIPPSDFWTYAGRANHGVISTATADAAAATTSPTGPSPARIFNRTQVSNMRTNAYLLSKAQLVRQD